MQFLIFILRQLWDVNSEFWKKVPILSLYPTILHFSHKSDFFQSEKSELRDINLMKIHNCNFLSCGRNAEMLC